MRYLILLGIYFLFSPPTQIRPLVPWAVVVRPATSTVKDAAPVRRRFRERAPHALRRVRHFFQEHRRTIAVGITLLLLLGRFVPGLNVVLMIGRGVRFVFGLIGRFRQAFKTRDQPRTGRKNKHLFFLLGLLSLSIGVLLSSTIDLGCPGGFPCFSAGFGVSTMGVLFLLVALIRGILRAVKPPVPDIVEIPSERDRLRNRRSTILLFYVLGALSLIVWSFAQDAVPLSVSVILAGISALGVFLLSSRLQRLYKNRIAGASDQRWYQRTGVEGRYSTPEEVPPLPAAEKAVRKKKETGGTCLIVLIVLIGVLFTFGALGC